MGSCGIELKENIVFPFSSYCKKLLGLEAGGREAQNSTSLTPSTSNPPEQPF